MRKTLTPLTVVVALLATAGPAAARPATYKGKTSSGHNITFKVKRNRIHDLRAGVRVSCIPIQGGGAPLGGSELFGFRGSVRFARHVRFSFLSKPAFHYKDATMKHDLWAKRRRGGAITGRMRIQYSFLVPKYPIGTFTVYSCLGGASFKARARR